MRTFMIIATALACALLSAPAMADMNVVVSGQACPFFAGQTFGSIPIATIGDSGVYHQDIYNLGSMPPSMSVAGLGGTTLSITATGTWGHPTLSGPDGYASYDPTHQEYVALGISSVLSTRLNTLLGVFLTDTAPVMGTAPSALTFGDNMKNPLVQQMFAIGSGLDNVVVPTGATRLFFGLNDGYEWINNVGELTVTAIPTPLPAGLLLGILGLSAAGWRLRKSA
jgi:hypothetical protein